MLLCRIRRLSCKRLSAPHRHQESRFTAIGPSAQRTGKPPIKRHQSQGARSPSENPCKAPKTEPQNQQPKKNPEAPCKATKHPEKTLKETVEGPLQVHPKALEDPNGRNGPRDP